MTDHVLRDLGFDSAAEILTSVGGGSHATAATDLSGHLIWKQGDEPDAEISMVIRELAAEGGPQNLERMLGDRGAVRMEPLLDASDSPRGWLVAWTSDPIQGNASSDLWKRVSETLPRVSRMLSNEFRLATELSGAVNELSSRYEELNIVYRIEREARDPGARSKVVQKMLIEFLRHFAIDVGLLIDSSGGNQFSGRGTERTIKNSDLVLTELRGKVWRFISTSRNPLVLNDRDDPRRAYLLTNLPFKMMAVPTSGCEEPDGAFIVLRHLDEPDFTNSDLSLARVFFSQAMILLRNQALVDRMEKFTHQIASSLVETVEAKDPYTRGHSERVEEITGGLATSLGAYKDDLTDLLWGALLHDIGKIGIPDAILMKPGRLTDDEYTFIKTHPNRSYEIMKHIEQLGPAALDAARFHQERFDGTGYPFGLAGTEIPLAARIVAVADTYDAVTSSRSYRAAMSHDAALEIIREASGIQLDPELVDAFLKRIEIDAEWLAAIRPNSGQSLDG